MRRDEERLADMVDAAVVCAGYIGETTIAHFLADGQLQDGVIRQLTIIGEAATRLSLEFRSLHSGIPWNRIAGMRHKLVHDYFGIDLLMTWEIATIFVPDLQRQLVGILAAEYPDTTR